MNLRINSLKASRRVAKPIKKGTAFLKVSGGVCMSKKAPSRAPSKDKGYEGSTTSYDIYKTSYNGGKNWY